MTSLYRIGLLSIAALAPALASAAPSLVPLQSYTAGIITVINTMLVPLIIGLCFITFIWGVFKTYILSQGDAAEVEQGHKLILWGIIGFVVILSVWGMVNLAKNVLNFGGDTNPTPPTFNTGA